MSNPPISSGKTYVPCPKCKVLRPPEKLETVGTLTLKDGTITELVQCVDGCCQ